MADNEEDLIYEIIQKILKGKDEEVDYSKIDNNPDYDDTNVLIQDSEDQFFADSNFKIVESTNDTGIQDF